MVIYFLKQYNLSFIQSQGELANTYGGTRFQLQVTLQWVQIKGFPLHFRIAMLLTLEMNGWVIIYNRPFATI